jgi:hypothetical protein
VNPEGLLEQSARFVEIAGTMPCGLGLRDYHQAPIRFEAAVARETILSFSPLLFRLQTPLPFHGRQIAPEIVDGVNDRLARMSARSAVSCRRGLSLRAE